MTPKWQAPRRLSRPVAKARPVTRESLAKQRSVQSRIGMQSARSRGAKRGGSR